MRALTTRPGMASPHVSCCAAATSHRSASPLHLPRCWIEPPCGPLDGLLLSPPACIQTGTRHDWSIAGQGRDDHRRGRVGPGWGNGRADRGALRPGRRAGSSPSTRTPSAMEETVARIREFDGDDHHPSCDVTDTLRVKRDGRGLHRRPMAASTSWSTTSAARPPAARSEMTEEVLDAQLDYNLKSVFLTCKHVIADHGAPGRRRHRQPRVDLRHPLDRRGAGRLSPRPRPA